MHWREKSLSPLQLSLLLLLLLAIQLGEAQVADLLQRDRVVQKFGLLAPVALLANYRLARLKDHRQGDFFVNDSCAYALDVYTGAIDRQESWALKMLDASSTVPSGILQGNIVELGSYDECVRVKGGEASGPAIEGQHCMYEISDIRERSLLPYNPSMSICLPRSCTVEDLAHLVRARANVTGRLLRDLEGLPVTASCINEEWKFWDAQLVTLLSIVGAYVGFLIVCTICDLAERWSSEGPRKPRKEVSALVKFSVVRSAEAILTLRPQPGNVPVINGIRFISSISIVLLHEYFFFGMAFNSNVFYIYEWLSSWRAVVPAMMTFSVDTFFTLSGFLMTCSFNKQASKKDFSVIRLYLHRFIRLTAPVVPNIFIAIILIPKLGSGPRWQWTKEIFFTSCQTKWWTMLFNVQNLVEVENYCLLELWTCSVDMQLYTLSLLIAYLFYKKQRVAVKIFALLVSTSIIITAVLVGTNRYSSMFISHEVSGKFVQEAFNRIYLMTYTRSAPFFIGVLFGYLVQNKSAKPSKATVRKAWLLTGFAFLCYPIAIRIVSDVNYKYSLIFEVLCSAFSRPIWSLMICWIIYSGINGFAGPLGKFLSWKYFLPLSRLSYSLYLVHLVFPTFRFMTSKTSWYFSDLMLIHSYLSNLVLSIIAAFLFCIAFEIPVFVLDDLILKKTRDSSSSENQKQGAEETKSHAK